MPASWPGTSPPGAHCAGWATRATLIASHRPGECRLNRDDVAERCFDYDHDNSQLDVGSLTFAVVPPRVVIAVDGTVILGRVVTEVGTRHGCGSLSVSEPINSQSIANQSRGQPIGLKVTQNVCSESAVADRSQRTSPQSPTGFGIRLASDSPKTSSELL